MYTALTFAGGTVAFVMKLSGFHIVTGARRNLAQLGHKNLIFAHVKCSFVDFFLLKYELTQAQAIKLLY